MPPWPSVESLDDVPGYQLLEVLGHGEGSRVWSAVELSTGRTVALKFFEPEAPSSRRWSPERIESTRVLRRVRFEREATIGAKFTGVPGLVQMFGTQRTVLGTPFLVMELLDARQGWESLEDRLSACEQLPEVEVLRIAAQMASALDAMHRVGVEHRDVKPSNLMVRGYDEHLEVKLLDYGIALDHALPRLTASDEVPGSLRYLSPAVLQGQPDAERDLYALGVVLFEALTGRLPHEGATLREVFTQKLTGEPTSVRVLRPTLSEPLAALVDDLVQQRMVRGEDLRERISRIRTEGELDR